MNVVIEHTEEKPFNFDNIFIGRLSYNNKYIFSILINRTTLKPLILNNNDELIESNLLCVILNEIDIIFNQLSARLNIINNTTIDKRNTIDPCINSWISRNNILDTFILMNQIIDKSMDLETYGIIQFFLNNRKE